MKLLHEFNIHSVPNYYVIGRKKRYTSMNLFYSNSHWTVRKSIVDMAKATLKSIVDPKLLKNKSKSVHIEYIYESKRTSFDIENRLGFWSKVFLDFVKGTKTIPDDNVKTIKSISYKFNYITSPNDNLKIQVYDISGIRNTDEQEEGDPSVGGNSRSRAGRLKNTK